MLQKTRIEKQQQLHSFVIIMLLSCYYHVITLLQYLNEKLWVLEAKTGFQAYNTTCANFTGIPGGGGSWCWGTANLQRNKENIQAVTDILDPLRSGVHTHLLCVQVRVNGRHQACGAC